MCLAGMVRKYPAVWLIGALTLLWATCKLATGYCDDNTCTMTFGRFVTVPLNFLSQSSKINRNYALYLFREGLVSLNVINMDTDARWLGGTPVLFIPGNAGSYYQGRAMASLAAHDYDMDWFLADFDEDLSAMHGRTLIDESRYINDAIDYILGLYKLKLEQMRADVQPDANGYIDPDVGFVLPQSVIIVGHSMGGIVARTLPTLDNYRDDSINTVITLSAPHAYPPITFDRDLTQLYDLIGQWWRGEEEAKNIGLVSINGGHSDLMVLPDMTSMNSLNGISVQSYEVPGVERGIDHIAVMWCAELREKVITAISEIADHQAPTRTIPYEEKMQILERKFKVPQESQLTDGDDATVVPVHSKIMLGLPSHHIITNATHFILPSKSSLVSYKITADQPVQVAQRTPNAKDAYRYYGETNSTTLMWYAAGPYVPQRDSEVPLLIAMVQPSMSPTKVTVSVDWTYTITNILVHYRTLAACWPFFLVLLCILSHFSNPSRAQMSFSKILVLVVTDRLYWYLSVLFVLLHLLLISPTARTMTRLIQFPSEAHNVASLDSVGYMVHDLFLGLYEPQLFWIGPVLLAISSSFVAVVCLVSICIVNARVKITNALKSKLVQEKPSSKQLPHTARKIATTVLMLAGLVCLLYVLPYQCTTVILAVIQLLRTSDTAGFEFAFSQLLAWAAVVDAPVIVVWARNLNLEWIWAFATFRNVVSVLPLTIYVLSGPQKLEFRTKWSRYLTLAMLGYMAMYAVIYAGLHGFMLHHLINYLSLWLLVLRLDQS